MLVVVSPAKRLNLNVDSQSVRSVPAFLDDAVYLAKQARGLSVPKLQKLMGISENLARLNADRFKSFAADPTLEQTAPAALLFAGDTYLGLEAASLDDDDMRWAQGHFRILSGLYGLLRPLDEIQPYRLEMGSRLATKHGKSLYDYWGERIAQALNADAADSGSNVLINCASVEYFSAVPLDALKPRVITPVFMEDKPGGPKIVSFFAKKARGAMARFIIERRLRDPDGLKDFDIGGYKFQPKVSDKDRLVFVRPESVPA